MKTVRLDATSDLTFDQAQMLTLNEARKSLRDPMILSWLNRETGHHCPDVDCCRAEGKESWEIYAESRGGTLRLEFGDQFVFILRAGLDG